jgi:hypothetical protein
VPLLLVEVAVLPVEVTVLSVEVAALPVEVAVLPMEVAVLSMEVTVLPIEVTVLSMEVAVLSMKVAVLPMEVASMKKSMLVGILTLILAISLTGYVVVGAKAAQNSMPLWGKLEWFELEVRPSGFRFAVVPDQAILFGKELGDKKTGGIWLVPRDDRNADSIIQTLDSLIRSHHIMESVPNKPEKSFREDTMQSSSIHLRVGYGSDGYGRNKRWQSYYEIDDVPSNIKAFVEACRTFGVSTISAHPSQVISGDKAKLLVTSEVAKIKITTIGEIYLNKRRVTLEELDVELRRLKKANGIVWYYREPEEPNEKVATVIHDVIEKIIELKLPIKLSEKDFQ